MKLTVRALERSDEAAFAALCQTRERLRGEAGEERARLVSYIAFENPVSDGGPTYYVVTDGERLLGHLGRMPQLFWIDGRSQPGAYAHDLYMHPELQQKGLAFFQTMRLYQALERDTPGLIIYCWTNLINIKLQQTRKVEELWTHRLVRPMRVDGKLARLERLPLVGRVGRGLGNVALAVSGGLLGLESRPLRTVAIPHFDERFDELAERVGPRLGVAPVKDRAYLAYKYQGRPGLSTRTFGVEGGGGLLGFVVLRVAEGPSAVGTLLDIVVEPGDGRTAISLLRRMVHEYRAARVGSIEAMASDAELRRWLRRMLFLPRGEPMPFFLGNLDKVRGSAPLGEIERFVHVYGDGEGPY